MKGNLTQLQRIEYIHRRLAWEYSGMVIYPNFRCLARELGVETAVVHEDVGIMRKMLGLPIVFDDRLRLSYTYLPQLNSDVFDLADKLLDELPRE